MSIMSDMKPTLIYNPKTGYDDFGRPVSSSKVQYEADPCLNIEMCINVQTNYSSNKNQEGEIRYSDITHLGLTTCRELKKGQKVVQDDHSYTIDLVPNTRGRLTQVYLKEVVDDE